MAKANPESSDLSSDQIPSDLKAFVDRIHHSKDGNKITMLSDIPGEPPSEFNEAPEYSSLIKLGYTLTRQLGQGGFGCVFA